MTRDATGGGLGGNSISGTEIREGLIMV
jgi:hypothetical protein